MGNSDKISDLPPSSGAAPTTVPPESNDSGNVRTLIRKVTTSAPVLVRKVTESTRIAAERSKTFEMNPSLYQNMWMGAMSGIIGYCIVYPIDLVKTKIQNYRGPVPAPTALQTFRHVLKAEGIRGLYKGLLPQIGGAGPEKAVTLASRDFFRHLMGDEESQKTIIVSGMLAGICQSLVVNPVEAIKVRLQLGEGRGSILGVMRQLGPRGAYLGFTAGLPRDIMFAGAYFTIYENAKRKYGVTTEDSSLKGLGLKILAGITAGAPAAFWTAPLDVIKTRLQAPNRAPDEGFRAVVRSIAQNEGSRGFFKGWGPRVGRIAPQYAIVLMTYETLHWATGIDQY